MKKTTSQTETEIEFQELFGKTNYKILRNSPYDFKLSLYSADFCTINGKRCSFFITQKPGAYAKQTVYNISYKGEIVFQNTSLKTLLNTIVMAEKIFG